MKSLKYVTIMITLQKKDRVTWNLVRCFTAILKCFLVGVTGRRTPHILWRVDSSWRLREGRANCDSCSYSVMFSSVQSTNTRDGEWWEGGGCWGVGGEGGVLGDHASCDLCSCSVMFLFVQNTNTPGGEWWGRRTSYGGWDGGGGWGVTQAVIHVPFRVPILFMFLFWRSCLYKAQTIWAVSARGLGVGVSPVIDRLIIWAIHLPVDNSVNHDTWIIRIYIYFLCDCTWYRRKRKEF